MNFIRILVIFHYLNKIFSRIFMFFCTKLWKSIQKKCIIYYKEMKVRAHYETE